MVEVSIRTAARGRYGSLHLHRGGLPPSTFCRSPGAPVHTWHKTDQPGRPDDVC
jgi:hypothetical protein